MTWKQRTFSGLGWTERGWEGQKATKLEKYYGRRGLPTSQKTSKRHRKCTGTQAESDNQTIYAWVMPDNKIPLTLTILKPKSYIFCVYCPIGLKFGGELDIKVCLWYVSKSYSSNWKLRLFFCRDKNKKYTETFMPNLMFLAFILAVIDAFIHTDKAQSTLLVILVKNIYWSLPQVLLTVTYICTKLMYPFQWSKGKH